MRARPRCRAGLGMGRKSSISRLEPEVKAYLEAQLARGAFTYNELIADLQQRFPTQPTPSRSAVHRYGQKLERRLQSVRDSTEAMRLLREHAGDDLDVRSEGLLALVQTELFEAMMELRALDDPDIDPAERVALLAKAGQQFASLARGSVTVKEFQAKAEERLIAKQRAALVQLEQSGQIDAATLSKVIAAAYGGL